MASAASRGDTSKTAALTTFSQAPSSAPTLAAGVSPPADPDKPVDWWARIIGGLGLGAALLNVAYGFWKDHKAWQRSVEDDFWFRKVAYPATLEVVIEQLTHLVNSLPKTLAPDELQAFSVKVTTDLSKLSNNLPMLGILSPETPQRVLQTLQRCEEHLLEHVNQLVASAGNTQPSATAFAVWEEVRATLVAVMAAQHHKWSHGRAESSFWRRLKFWA